MNSPQPREISDRERAALRRRRMMMKKRRRRRIWLTVIALMVVVCAAVAVALLLPEDGGLQAPGDMDIELPDWVKQDLLPVNDYSRPGTPLERVDGVVVHYVGNPGTTAEQNRSYFKNLAQTHETYASSHFLIGMDGTVILCVPLDEIAYCSNQRNEDTISIECCHPDETGEFTPETLESLTSLLRWLSETFEIEREQVIRHYDVTGKICPKYFVDHPEEWETYLDQVFGG